MLCLCGGLLFFFLFSFWQRPSTYYSPLGVCRRFLLFAIDILSLSSVLLDLRSLVLVSEFTSSCFAFCLKVETFPRLCIFYFFVDSFQNTFCPLLSTRICLCVSNYAAFLFLFLKNSEKGKTQRDYWDTWAIFKQNE